MKNDFKKLIWSNVKTTVYWLGILNVYVFSSFHFLKIIIMGESFRLLQFSSTNLPKYSNAWKNKTRSWSCWLSSSNATFISICTIFHSPEQKFLSRCSSNGYESHAHLSGNHFNPKKLFTLNKCPNVAKTILTISTKFF